jgi:L-ribulokinase
MDKLIIGIDYGTDSCRAIIVNATTGKQIGEYVAFYPRWKQGMYCNANINQYRQHPQDYIDSLEEAVKGVLAKLSQPERQNIIALGIDTTGSTPCLTDRNGTPLALLPEYANDPDAMFILWKDHTSIRESKKINELAHSWQIDYTSFSGGSYSSEWFWSKALHVITTNADIRKDAYAVIEHCDWMPALLTGNLRPEVVKRSRCAAGHKCMWAEEWGGYPSQNFFSQLDPLLGDFVSHLSNTTYTSDKCAGKITREWSDRLGLPSHTNIAVGILDAHAGAIGAEIKPNTMVKIIGTSTCDIIVTSKQEIGDKQISGISGQVDGSVIPELIGMEAGQSAFGDVYAWFKEILSWSINLLPIDIQNQYKEDLLQKLLPKLAEEAEKIPLKNPSVIANDWLNGRRSPYADPNLKGGIIGLTLGTSPAQIYKSLVEATACGSRAIMDHFEKEGIKITEVIGVGGISLKSPFVMQTLSDIMEVPIKVATTQQAGSMGVAMCAAVAAGLYENVLSAQSAMGQGYISVYNPRLDFQKYFRDIYFYYKNFGTYLSTVN